MSNLGQLDVRYATSGDGTDIAFSVFGQGEPLILLENYVAAGLDVRLQEVRNFDFYHAISQKHQVIAMDWRNTGLSSRASSISVDALCSDALAVLDHLGLGTVDVVGHGSACQVAISLAASVPARVRKLVLMRPRPAGWSPISGYGPAIAGLVQSDWEAFTIMVAQRNYGWTETGRLFMESIRRQWTPVTFQSFMAEVEKFDVFSKAQNISATTLILAAQIGPEAFPETVRLLAATIPECHVVVLPVEYARDPVQAPFISSFVLEADTPSLESDGDVASSQAIQAARSLHDLTKREIEVLSMVSRGMTNQAIAKVLVLSPRTVERHVANVYSKLGVHTRVGISAIAIASDLSLLLEASSARRESAPLAMTRDVISNSEHG